MKSKKIIQELVEFPMLGQFLAQCRVRSLTEDETVHVPPSKDEVRQLMVYLKSKGVKPAIIGSVGVLYHLGDVDTKKFRPTVDLDVWVNKNPPEPPEGWIRDPEAVGVVSWISPSGGYVDFLTSRHEFPGGMVAPSNIEMEPSTAASDYPVASWKSLMKLKLASYREKDLADLMSLVRKLGRVPSSKELGGLNSTQKDNLNLITTWHNLRPEGLYGE